MDNHPQTSMFQQHESALAFDERQGANFECKVLARRWKGDGALGQWEYRVHYLGWKAKWDQWLTNKHVFKRVQHNIKLLETQMGERPLTKKEKKALAEAEKANKQEERDAIRKKREAKKAAEKAAQEAAREAERLARQLERDAAAAAKKAEAEAAAAAKKAEAAKAKRKNTVPADTDPAQKKRKTASEMSSKRRRLGTGDEGKAAQKKAKEEVQHETEDQEEWLTTGHRWIGLKGMRHFHDGSVFGDIVSWLPARASATPEPDDVALWRFQHADGDQEDLEEHEVREAVSELREHEARKAAPQRSAEENWEAFVKLRDAHRAQAALLGGWQCNKGDKLLCFDRNKSTASSVEVANCYEAVVLRVRPAGAIRVTTSPPSGEDASLATATAPSADAEAPGDKTEATAADTSAAASNPATCNSTDAEESSPAGLLSASTGAETCTPFDDHCAHAEEPRFYLHFLGYSKGQDRWECESNFVPLTEEARVLKETMHNQWDRKKSTTCPVTACRLPGDPENMQLVRGAVRYGATVPDVIPESLNGILPAAPETRKAKQGDLGDTAPSTTADAGSTGNGSIDASNTIAPHVQTASLHLRQFGCTTLEAGLGEDDVSACATVIEAWFNHVVVKLNTLGLQEVMKNVGFTEFKTRGPGRYDLNPPALKNDDAFAFFRSEQAPWVEVCRSILGDDMQCIAMGCMLSMPGSDAQPMHQDGPHMNADEYDKQEKRRVDAEAKGSKSKQSRNVQHLPPYAINVFVPLVDITVENGGTEFWLGTHRLGVAVFILSPFSARTDA